MSPRRKVEPDEQDFFEVIPKPPRRWGLPIIAALAQRKLFEWNRLRWINGLPSGSPVRRLHRRKNAPIKTAAVSNVRANRALPHPHELVSTMA